MIISPPLLSQLFLKYAYKVNVLIHQHLTDSPKLLKNNLIAENLNEVKSSSLTKLFFKSLGESAKCH